jgi:soluble lytic murein transglycosylase-like protein
MTRQDQAARPVVTRRARRVVAALASLGLLLGTGAAGYATHTYVVRPGDSLWAISRANGLTVSQLAAANHLRVSDVLLIGRLLVIPSSQQAGTGQSALSGGGSSTYLVQPGDSLWAIARANGLTVSQLAAANQMSVSELLLIGRQLVIPSGQQPDMSQQASNSQPAAPANRSAAPASTENIWAFCSSLRSGGGPWGVLPPLLQESPGRLALQPLFVKWASQYNLSLSLLEAIAWQESGWQQGVVASDGGVGTGQLMPGTARFISGSIIGMRMNIRSASDNIRMSAAFLAYLAGVEGNNQCATIAAYNEGPLNLNRYGIIPQTQSYVASVEALIPRFE